MFVPPRTSGRKEGSVAPNPGLHSHSFRPLLPAIVTGRGSGHSVPVVAALRSPVVISDPRRKLVLSKHLHGSRERLHGTFFKIILPRCEHTAAVIDEAADIWIGSI